MSWRKTDEESSVLSFVPILTQILYQAGTTSGFSGDAGVASQQDEPVVGIEHEFFGNESQQAFFNFQWGFTFADTGAIGDPEYVGVHCHGRLAKSGIEHYISGFSAYTGQRFQVFSFIRHLSSVLLQQYFTAGDDVFCLAVAQANGSYVLA